MSRPTRILIRAAAGPRIGFGHLIRSRSLGRALAADVRVSVRGGDGALGVAERIGLALADSDMDRAVRMTAPDLVVIDDPSRTHGQSALAAARRAGTPVASIHDRGIALIDSDLIVDGSIAPPMCVRERTHYCGPRFAILDPAFADHARRPSDEGSLTAPRVLIALGGGPRIALATALADAIVAHYPRARVRVAGGLIEDAAEDDDRVRWIGPRPSLVPELKRCDVAVVAGGVTLYEACALGVPAVAVAIVTPQIGTVRAFARAGAALDGGCAIGDATKDLPYTALWAGLCVERLTSNGTRRDAMSRRGRRLVDGRGAQRVAAALLRLARAARPSTESQSSAADALRRTAA